MKISGFSMIRNGETLGYPYLEAIQSILPICDEFIIAVGDSDDDTRTNIAALHNNKIKIIDTIWDESLRRGGTILAQQTNIAFQQISGDWGFYIQGDEVVHEKYLNTIQKNMELYLNNDEVEGLLFKYKHFYGSYAYVASSVKWYRNEIRVIRNNKDIYSYKDAQGFRIHDRKLQVKPINAEIYHFGWCRPPEKQQLKQTSFNKLYHNDDWIKDNIVVANEYDYSTFQKLDLFTETYPSVMKFKISTANWKFEYDSSKVKLSFKDKFKLWVEKWLGFRPFEYKNYKII